MAGGSEKRQRSVEVSTGAAVSMVLHAVKHSHEAVHGVLLGSFDKAKDTVKVSQAVPVCHGVPTHPLLETALALISSSKEDADVVVGWYVSPRLEHDERPGPAALKIVSGLATSEDKKEEPALIFLSNKDLADVLHGTKDSKLDSSFLAFGKDFGKQWLDPLKIGFDNESSIKAAVKKAFQQEASVVDLVDHFEMEAKQSKWFPNDSLKGLLS